MEDRILEIKNNGSNTPAAIIGNIHGRSNYHTHTAYCDGSDKVDDMVRKAISLGFTSIGLSGHQFSPQDAHYAMDLIGEERYKEDILEARKKYQDKIKIYLGIERDYCSEATSGFDYVIGSLHHVEKEGVWMNVDESPKTMEEGVKTLFDGDYMAYVKAYYDLEAHILEKTEGQIVGHFDLVAKFNCGNKYFDEDSYKYKKMAIDAMDRIIDGFSERKNQIIIPKNFPEELRGLLESGKPIFEINTGAMAKGYRNTPYPAPFLMEHLIMRGVPMIMSSDCHRKEYLDFGFCDLMAKYG